jgi:flagellar motility protein MotE (MotC chaperone)
MNNFLKEYWNQLIVIILIVICVFFWNLYNQSQDKIIAITNQLNIQEEIEKTEARLKEVQEREQQYKELVAKQNNLIKTLNELDIRQKELEKRKKGVIANEIKNYTQDDIRNALTNIGITSTVVK